VAEKWRASGEGEEYQRVGRPARLCKEIVSKRSRRKKDTATIRRGRGETKKEGKVVKPRRRALSSPGGMITEKKFMTS